MVFSMAISWQFLLAGRRPDASIGRSFFRRSDCESFELAKAPPPPGASLANTPIGSSVEDMALPQTESAAKSVATRPKVARGAPTLAVSASVVPTGPTTPDPTPQTEGIVFAFETPQAAEDPMPLQNLPPPMDQPSCKEQIVAKIVAPISGQRYIALVVALLVLVAVPLAAARGEDRPMDFLFLCLFWIGTRETQKALWPTGTWTLERRRLALFVNLLATLANPVLLTTACMIAYTQAKAHARHDPGMVQTLATFASRTSVSSLLSYHAGIHPLPKDRVDWFGAGDVALALLDCGIVAWGFKLYECRRQLLSPAGCAAVLTSASAAVFTVFVSPLVVGSRGAGLGLAAPEALAFAARSTTLALSRPAMEALDGNMMINAAVVVANGIIGQWIYPFAPRLLGVHAKETIAVNSADSLAESEATSSEAPLEAPLSSAVASPGPIVSAAGVTVGVNGAAMGVAYLYTHDAESALFAALTMTIFGVMTVIFTCVAPFTEVVRSLA
jgi:putative effector of murein hydrolase